MYRRTTLVWFLLLGVLLPSPAVANPDVARTQFKAKRREMLAEAGKRHVEVGIWCRDAGLVAQASAEFIRATEVSEGNLPWADRILAFMRKLGDKFWKKVMKKVGKAYLRTYRKKSDKAHRTFQKERFKLARWASKKKLSKEAYDEYAALVRLSDNHLVFDKKGLVKVDAGTIPDPYSKQLRENAIKIRDKLYVRDAFLAKLPQVKELFEAENDHVRVRADTNQAQVDDLLAISTALLPVLEDDMGGSPNRKLNAFVFATTGNYHACLDALELSSHKNATGVADGATFNAIINGEGLSTHGLQAVVLHELSHLFQYGVNPVIMPSWYNEGFAETYGGDGTFQWDGKTLKAKGLLNPGELVGVKADGYIALEKLMQGDALELINEGRAGTFYGQSWAFLRYMTVAADEDVKKRFRRWWLICFGKALGAKAGERRSRDATEATKLFQSMFALDMDQIEVGFKDWLKTL